MKRLVCVLASMLVLVLTAGGDLNGYDRFGGPRGGDGEASYNPEGDDHPWGGDQFVIETNEPTTRNDDRTFDTGGSVVNRIFIRVVVWLLPDVVATSGDARTVSGDSRQESSESAARPNSYRRVTTKQVRVER